MFDMFGKKHFTSEKAMAEAINRKNAKIMHMDAVSSAFNKVADASFGTAGAAAAVAVGSNYYAAQNRLNRKGKKTVAKVSRTATTAMIAGVGIGSICTVMGAITQPLPIDPTKYVFDGDTTEQQVAEAEEAVDAKIAPETTENKEGAEQNAQ